MTSVSIPVEELEEYDPTGIMPTENEHAAEQSVLGAMLQSAQAIADVKAVMLTSDFYAPRHQQIASVAVEMWERNQPADPVTLAAELEARGQLQLVGGAPYLHTLFASCPTATSASYYAEIVRTASSRRAWMRAAQRMHRIGMECRAGSPVAADLDAALQQVVEQWREETSPVTRAPAPFGAHLEEWLDDKLNGEPPAAYDTGLADLDEITDVRPGELLVVAARPSIGKSVMAQKFATHQAIKNKVPVLFYALEMSRSEMTDRIMASYARVEHGHLRDKKLTEFEQQQLRAKIPDLVDSPLWIEDGVGVTIEQIRATARTYVRDHGLQVLVVDQLSLVEEPAGRKGGTREEAVGMQSRALQMLAKELSIVVVMVVQINRAPSSRTDKTPQLNDLRESGRLEADADQVWLLHRPEFGVPFEHLTPEHRPGEVQILVAKHRGGTTGDRWFAFQGGYQNIVDMPR